MCSSFTELQVFNEFECIEFLSRSPLREEKKNVHESFTC